MSNSKIEDMAYQLQTRPAVNHTDIGGYRIYRSPIQVKYVNVVAVDKNDNMLAVVASDMTIDEAGLLVEMLNEEFEQTQE